jgi:CheY-like chemotaxis protein
MITTWVDGRIAYIMGNNPENNNRVDTAMEKQTILIVDDEPAVRQVSQLYLEQNGFRILIAENGPQALKIFHEHGSTIDLVLLDLTMPEMSGEEVLHKLRGMRTDIRIILSSGYSEQEILGLIEGATYTSFIRKPYRPKALLDKVLEMLALLS